jgi:hypothetical protein
MRKLVFLATLTFFSAFAFSQEANQRVVPVAVVSSPAPSLESAANSVGKWLGRMVQAPVAVAKSLASGVKAGYTDSAIEAPLANPVSEAPTSKDTGSVGAMFDGVLAFAKTAVISKQAPAPVEDRSTYSAATANEKLSF